MERNNFRFCADLLLPALEDGMIKVIVTPKEIRNRKRLREEPTKELRSGSTFGSEQLC
jgi:hypothetical protein